MLALRKVTHRYPRAKDDALREVTLAVQAGERVAVIGESGSGKSTLLSIMSGLLAPSSGAATLSNRDIAAVPPADRDIALVFQAPPHMPGVRAGDLLSRPAHRAGGDVRSRVARALEAVGLPGFEGRRLDELSGGERQRCFLARTFVWRPKLMLLDEPFSNLDVATKREIVPALLAHHAETGAGLVFITHDADEASLIADRYLLLQDGVIVAEGRTALARSQPANAFSALVFQGAATNLIPAVLGTGGLAALGSRLEGSFEGEAPSGSVLFSIAAEDLVLAADASNADAALAVEATRGWTPVRSGALAVTTFAFGSLYASDGRGGAVGRCLVVRASSVPLFDAASGRRLGTFSLKGR